MNKNLDSISERVARVAKEREVMLIKINEINNSTPGALETLQKQAAILSKQSIALQKDIRRNLNEIEPTLQITGDNRTNLATELRTSTIKLDPETRKTKTYEAKDLGAQMLKLQADKARLTGDLDTCVSIVKTCASAETKIEAKQQKSATISYRQGGGA
jgi:hypothetical protein